MVKKKFGASYPALADSSPIIDVLLLAALSLLQAMAATAKTRISGIKNRHLPVGLPASKFEGRLNNEKRLKVSSVANHRRAGNLAQSRTSCYNLDVAAPLWVRVGSLVINAS
tara:strand:- start:1181 stop:1516 length:336 start_codon:yes stop_codon:yes gene_type:complete